MQALLVSVAPLQGNAVTPGRLNSAARHAIIWAGLIAPGLLLCAGVTLAAKALERIEILLAGAAWLEALLLAILIGTAIRSAWTPGQRWTAGIDFGAKIMLEVAVVLLGASVSARTVLAAGPSLLIGIACVVLMAIACSYGIGRCLGLQHRLATLIACGNAICGNSAIAAVAPIIGADGEDMAASIAFTAVLGVAVVLALPLAERLLHLSAPQYGALAGLTVYAVPQVLAATAPIGPAAVQIGTIVKLVRVLMLGPVVLCLSLLKKHFRDEAGQYETTGKPKLYQLVPWFIAGFLALAGCRSAGLIPAVSLAPVACLANLLTILSMAALGLSTDLRAVARAGGSAIASVSVSLLVLGVISLGLIHLLRFA